MRNISFMLTTKQFKNRTKTVTRRNGWEFLKEGDQLMGCEKCQGLKKGEKIKRLGPIEVISIRREPLNFITQEDCALEGFPEMTPGQFIEMYCKHNKWKPEWPVARIEYRYL